MPSWPDLRGYFDENDPQDSPPRGSQTASETKTAKTQKPRNTNGQTLFFDLDRVQVGLRKGSRIDIEARALSKNLQHLFERAPGGLRSRKKVVQEGHKSEKK